MEANVSINSRSVKNLFGIGVTSACPLATSSRVFLDINDDANESEILPVDVGEKILSMGGREIFVYDVKTLVSRGVSNIQVTFPISIKLFAFCFSSISSFFKV